MTLVRVLTVLVASLLLSACEDGRDPSGAAPQEPSCLPGTVRCDRAACTTLATDALNCGACGSACPAGEVCSAGVCAVTCGAPLSTCETGAGRACADLRSDPANCGACGASCAATEVCQAGACVDTCALAGNTRCGAACVDLASSSAHCGACGASCTATEVCQAGECVDTCTVAGTSRCGAACVELASSSGHCGACGTACEASAICRAGACVDGCDLAGTSRCGESCVDLASDDAHCGACANACSATAVCRSGACIDTCTLAGASRCGGACVDLRSDAAHCGACGRACPGWGLCTGGACVPPACRRGVALPDASPLLDGAPLPTGVRAVDLNGDGLEDIVTHSRWSANRKELTVALALAAGGVAPADTYVVHGAGALVAADLDRDGDLDLSIAGWPSTLLVNDGAGRFTVSSGVGPLQLVADLDGDGTEDWVMEGSGVQGLEVYLASTTAVQRYRDGTWPLPRAFAAGDLTGDGRPELVVARGHPLPLQVMLNAGDGTFAPVAYDDPALGDVPDDVELADVDGDGDRDVVLLSGSGEVVVGLNDGAGGLSRFKVHTLPAAPWPTYYDLLVHDVNGDRRIDALVASKYHGVLIASGAGDGTFGAPAWIRTGPTYALDLTDLDRDGRLDLLGATPGGALVLLGRGGTFAHPPVLPLASASLAAADLDRDGRDDLVSLAATAAGSTSVLVLRTGSGAPTAFPAPGATSLAVADVDGDGIPDLIVSGSQAGVAFLRGRGDASFDPAVALSAVRGGAALAADVTGDGVLDLVTNEADPHARRYLRVAVGRGHATFEPVGAATEVRLSSESQLGVGDVDGDRRADIVLSRDEPGVGVVLTVLRSRGDGTFAAAVERNLGGYALEHLIVTDLDGDGLADVAAAVQDTIDWRAPARLGVLYSEAGILQAPAWHVLPDAVWKMSALRGTGGRRRDLFAILQEGVALLSAEGARGFAPAARFAWPLGASAAAGADLDGDLRDEILVTDGTSVTVLRTACAP